MLIEAPIGHILDNADALSGIDWVDLSWRECGRRALRKRSRSGEPLRILLRLGVTLRHGDLLRQAADGILAIAVNVLPCEVLVASPRDAQQLFAAAMELGNLHAPAQFSEGQIITVCDGPIEAVFHRLGIAHKRLTRRFEPFSSTGMRFEPAPEFKLIAR